MAVIRWFQRLINRILLIEHEPPPAQQYVPEEHATDTHAAAADDSRPAPAEMPVEGSRIHVMRTSRSDYSQMPIVLARPRNMEDATSVADRVKDRVPVLMNLEGVDDSMVRRIVDFVGGVVFALDGSIKKTGRAVYVCTPVDIPFEELRATPMPRRTTLFDLGSSSAEEPQQAVVGL